MYPKDEEIPLNSEIDQIDDSDDSVGSLDLIQTRRTRRAIGCCRCIAWSCSLMALIFLSGLTGAYISAAYTNIDQNCASHTAQWSPLLDDVQIEYSPQNFDGKFMEESIYRRQGGPEVDAAWEALGVDYRAGIISYEDGLASGLDPSYVQRSEQHGGGFLVNVEGMHHLHCLNLLRKSLYFNFDHYKKLKTHAFENDDNVLRLHVTHCLDTIRQVLMCNADTGVLGQVWVGPEDPTAFPDFNTQHVCKNYDNIRAWAEKIQAPPIDELPDDYLAQPQGDDILLHTP